MTLFSQLLFAVLIGVLGAGAQRRIAATSAPQSGFVLAGVGLLAGFLGFAAGSLASGFGDPFVTKSLVVMLVSFLAGLGLNVVASRFGGLARDAGSDDQQE